jgi:hypothetical protein
MQSTSNFIILKIVKSELKNKQHMIFFPIRCHDCLENKIPHIAHFTS